MSDGKLPRRAHLGLRLGPPPAAEGPQAGLVVRAVVPESSAERAGVRAGDRVLAVGGIEVADVATARSLLRALNPGDELELELTRDGEPLALTGIVQAFPLERHAGARVWLDEVAVGRYRRRAISVVPDGPGPFPCAYYLPGAHWASEEYPLRPEHPVPSLLGLLARAGIASYRVERSGMGDSEGPLCTRVGFAEELAGYRAGLERLGEQPWVDRERVFLLGHSLGASLAPLLAAETRVAGVVVFGPSALRISEGLVGAARRDDERERARGRAPLGPVEPRLELIRLVAGGMTPDEVYRARPDLAGVAPDRFAGDEAFRRVASFYHELERQDLEAAWRRVDAPVLAIHGARDWICVAEYAERIASVARDGMFLELAGVDHQLSDAPEGEPLHFASALGDAIVAWIRSRIGEAARG